MKVKAEYIWIDGYEPTANLRSKRPPEPFKGKGIKYSDEFIFRKEGKKK